MKRIYFNYLMETYSYQVERESELHEIEILLRDKTSKQLKELIKQGR